MRSKIAPRIKRLISAMAFLSTVGLAHAGGDLGVVGPLYEIAEPDLIEVFKDKFRELEKTGELAQWQKKYQDYVIASIERPRPVPGVKPTETARTYYVDPTWVQPKDIVDKDGRILYPAGTKINPLDYDKLTKTLLFFDGSDPKQRDFVKQFISSHDKPVKPILVAGPPLELMREWKIWVYYDQGGVLVRKFGIRQSPAIVTQEGRLLRVDEIRLSQ